MNDAKFGEALAKTMDRIDKLDAHGDLEGFELQEVLVVAAYTRLIKPDDEIEPDAVETMVFVDGSTQIPYVQYGILTMAREIVLLPVGDE